jgi:hypothetical protein
VPLTPEQQAEHNVLSRLDNTVTTAYHNVREDILNTYRRDRGQLYQGVRNISYRLDKYESCDWPCVQGCYNDTQNFDVAEDCF